MPKFLMCLGAVLLMGAVVVESGPVPVPIPEPGILGPHDYLPPLTATNLQLKDLRPDEDRTCVVIGEWWDTKGCTLRGMILGCHDDAGKWSQDVHTWKFDGYACRYNATTMDVEPPREAGR
jgi:hypothetical protein